MVARKFLVHHNQSLFHIDYDTEDGLDVLKFQLFSLTLIPPDEQKIFGEKNVLISTDSELDSVAEKLRLVSIGHDGQEVEEEEAVAASSSDAADLLKSDEELARTLQKKRGKLGVNDLARIRDLKKLSPEDRSWKVLLQPERLHLAGLDSAVSDLPEAPPIRKPTSTDMVESRPSLKPISKVKAPPRSALLSGTRLSKQPKTAPKAKEPAISAASTPAAPIVAVLFDVDERVEEVNAAPELRPAVEVPRQREGLSGESSIGEMTQQEPSPFHKVISGMVPWAIAHGSEKDFASLYNAPTTQTLGHVAKALLELAPCVFKACSELTAAQKLAAEAEGRREVAENQIGVMTGDLSFARRAAEDAKKALEVVKAESARLTLLLTKAEEENRHLRQIHGACEGTLARAKAEAATLIQQAQEEAGRAKEVKEQPVEAFLKSQEFEEERDRLYQGGYRACVLEMRAAFPNLNLSAFEEGSPEAEAAGVGHADASVGEEAPTTAAVGTKANVFGTVSGVVQSETTSRVPSTEEQ